MKSKGVENQITGEEMSQKQIVQSYFENRRKVNGQKLLGKEEMSQKEMQLESFWERANVAKGNVEEQMAQEQRLWRL